MTGVPASHRAYVFDLDAFKLELRPILEDALQTRDPERLRHFISTHFESLKDPYAGEALGEDWEQLLETRDVQEYGEFALTKYYDPSDDIGLGAEWPAFEAMVLRETKAGTDLTMGSSVGRAAGTFDPGQLGSYFLTNEEAKARLKTLRGLASEAKTTPEHLSSAIAMFETIVESGKGAYVTF